MEKPYFIPINLIRRFILETFYWKSIAYKKFIIISHGRSGSTYFKSLINAHPNLKCYGELFNIVPKKTFFRPDHFPVTFNESSEKLEAMRRNNALQFMDKYIWRKHEKKLSGIGFKLFYYHAHAGKWSEIWDNFKQNKNIYIIHLHRKNRLKSFLSLQLAKKYDKWHSNIENPEPMHLDYEDCLKYFTELEDFEKETDIEFKDHPFHKLYYEDLSANKKDEMAKVFNFLDVKNHETQSTFKKLKKKPLSVAITNYAELKQQFTNSKWIEFFIE